ncbi:hypothetical protein ACOK4R_18205 [Pseudomonas fluorescens]|uniref:hypothetical protein n=1 Tax=Pseudomonas fluorescens TaxID=294 RepID=UPI001FD07913|nr:hypothetical protein [Pseudomonas fluorescens]
MAENGLGVRQLSFDFSADVLTFELTDSHATHRLTVGVDHWLACTTSMPGRALHHGYESTMRRSSPVLAGWMR